MRIQCVQSFPKYSAKNNNLFKYPFLCLFRVHLKVYHCNCGPWSTRHFVKKIRVTIAPRVTSLSPWNCSVGSCFLLASEESVTVFKAPLLLRWKEGRGQLSGRVLSLINQERMLDWTTVISSLPG